MVWQNRSEPLADQPPSGVSEPSSKLRDVTNLGTAFPGCHNCLRAKNWILVVTHQAPLKHPICSIHRCGQLSILYLCLIAVAHWECLQAICLDAKSTCIEEASSASYSQALKWPHMRSSAHDLILPAEKGWERIKLTRTFCDFNIPGPWQKGTLWIINQVMRVFPQWQGQLNV